MDPDCDLLVIGGGAVGLAVAREAAARGHPVTLIERHAHFGMETSSRNSEVIHAGIYYPAESLKSRTCVEGRQLLYDFARRRGVPHRQCGKFIVASEPGQEAQLAALAQRGFENGVVDLELLGRSEIAALEPDLRAVAALHSPSTGIIDSHAFMMAMAGEAEAFNASLICNASATSIRRDRGCWRLCIEGEESPVLSSRWVANCGGLSAPRVARMIDGYEERQPEPREWAKGNYFGYAGKIPFSHLIYPLPVPGGLGIHLTLDLAGRARFGPDVSWTSRPDYDVDPGLLTQFGRAIASYWPAVDIDRLHPDYAGIRPKLGGCAAVSDDFCIEGTTEHGLPGIINLLGIESPGLTAALALAKAVLQRLEQSDVS
jgi:L-2-hydroxyglutarate oxidase LhgO